MEKRIGITGMMPIEIIFDSGSVPLDVRNFFLYHPDRMNFVQRAEMDGFPHNAGLLEKGIYGTIMEEKIQEVIVIIQNDCINGWTLRKMLELQGVTVHTFTFPPENNREMIEMQINELAERLGLANLNNLDYWKFRLNEARELAHKIDELTWNSNLVSGYENHKYLTSTTDFEGDLDVFMTKLYNFLNELKTAKPFKQKVRLALIGEPPLCTEIYKIVEKCGARIVFNEVQRQYTIPFSSSDLIDQYLKYTYPYSISGRVKDIKEQIKKRKIHGIIHCVNTHGSGFADDLIFRRQLGLP
ncbi:2-hydroxyacyl-CoA dehydratase, partial [bacterium]